MSAMAYEDYTVPKHVAVLGWLGLLPFLLPPIVGFLQDDWAPTLTVVETAYAGLILSFLGGARWGQAIQTDRPDCTVVSLAMLPTIVALVLLAAPSLSPGVRMGGLAFALVLHWLWDIRAVGLPRWYASLRTKLTIGAVIGLLACIVILPR
jgi:hypothetical protein